MGLRAKLSQYLSKLAEQAGVTEADMIKDIQKGLKDPKDLPDEVVKRYNETFAGQVPESEGAKTLRETIQANEPPKQLTAGVPVTTSQERGLVPTLERPAMGATERRPLMLEGEVLGTPSPRMSTAEQSTIPLEQRAITAEDIREPSPRMSLKGKVATGLGLVGAGGVAVSGKKPSGAPPSASATSSVPAEEEMPSKAQKGRVNSGNKQIDTLVNSSSKIRVPDDISALREQAEELADKLSPMNRRMYEDKLAKLEQERKDAEQLYKDKANRTEWLEVAEKIGHAFAQLGAAAHGLATGVDLSGLKFDKTDWSKKFDRLMGELDATKKDIGSREKLTSEAKSERDRMAESLFDQLVRGKLTKEQQAFQTKEREKEQAFRASEGEKDRASRERIMGEEKAAVRAEKDKNTQLGALNELETTLGNLDSMKTREKTKALQDLRKTFSKVPGFNIQVFNKAIDDYNSSFLASSKEKALAPLMDEVAKYRNKLQGGQTEIGGAIMMKNPQGQTVRVPADKVEAARKAGYTE